MIPTEIRTVRASPSRVRRPRPRNPGGLWLVPLLLAGAACAGHQVESKPETPTRPIEAVLNDHAKEMMAIPGVTGVATGSWQGQPCIRVFVAERTPALAARLPARLEGYLVDVVESGEFHALPRQPPRPPR